MIYFENGDAPIDHPDRYKVVNGDVLGYEIVDCSTGRIAWVPYTAAELTARKNTRTAKAAQDAEEATAATARAKAVADLKASSSTDTKNLVKLLSL